MIEDRDTTGVRDLNMGDKVVFSRVYIKHYDYLLHYGTRIIPQKELVEGCIQDLFLQLYLSPPQLIQKDSLKAYLFTALRRRILVQAKKERRQHIFEEQLLFNKKFYFSSEDLEVKLDSGSTPSEKLIAVLNSLPWRQREAIYLRYFNSLRTKEIAEVMGIANQTVLNMLYQALKKMRNNRQFRELIGFFMLIISHL